MVKGSRKAGAGKILPYCSRRMKLQPTSRGRLSLRQSGQMELQPHLSGCGKDTTALSTLAVCQLLRSCNTIKKKLCKGVVTCMVDQHVEASHPCN